MDHGARFPSCNECDVDRVGSVTFHSQFFKPIFFASRLVCSFCEAMPGSLSVASTAVSLAKVAVVDPAEVGRSAVYSRYNNDPMMLPCVTPALIAKSYVLSLNFYEELSTMQIGF
jgi:hypothetical protein